MTELISSTWLQIHDEVAWRRRQTGRSTARSWCKIVSRSHSDILLPVTKTSQVEGPRTISRMLTQDPQIIHIISRAGQWQNLPSEPSTRLAALSASFWCDPMSHQILHVSGTSWLSCVFSCQSSQWHQHAADRVMSSSEKISVYKMYEHNLNTQAEICQTSH